MPFNNIVTPRADLHIMQGAAALGGGIGYGLERIGDAIGKIAEEKKRKGDLAAALRRTLTIAYPEQKDQFNSMGLPDLQGFLQGQAVKSARDNQQAQLEELQRALATRQATTIAAARLGQTGQNPEDVQGLDSVLSPAEGLRRTSMPTGPDLLREFSSAARQTGGQVDPRSLSELSDAIARLQPKPIAPVRGLPFGVTRPIEGVNNKVLVGTGEESEPNVIDTTPPKQPVVIPQELMHLVTAPDDKTFLNGIKTLNPDLAEAVTKLRIHVNSAAGRDNSVLLKALDKIFPGSAQKAADTAPASRPGYDWNFDAKSGKLVQP